MKLGHVHLKVRNLQNSIDFYQRYLDLRVTEQVGERMAFLSAGAMHHEVALQEVGGDAAVPQRFDVGLYHAAFEVADADELATVWTRLEQGGVRVYPVDHRISRALYFCDPDGNGLEIYLDTRETDTGATSWQGIDRPLKKDMRAA